MSTVHAEPHPLAEQAVQLTDAVRDHWGQLRPGGTVTIDDWWDRVTGGRSWRDSNGSPVACAYGLRIGMSFPDVPPDDEVVHVEDDHGCKHLVHANEITAVPS